MIFIQATGQIKNLYKDDWETIKGACSIILYLGGNETSTHEEIVKMAGKETMRVKDSSQSTNEKGSGSSSRSYKYAARDLLTIDEVRRLKNRHALCFVSGQQPIYDPRYPTQNHPNAKYLGNLKTGENLYTFTYCNAKSSSLKKLEKNKKILEEQIKERQKSRNPDVRPISNPTAPDLKAMQQVVENKTDADELLNSVAKVGIKEEDMKAAGVTAGTVENGKRKEVNYSDPSKKAIVAPIKTASASATPRGAILVTNNAVSDADMDEAMNLLGSVEIQ